MHPLKIAMLLWSNYWVTQKAASFEWGPGQKKALQQVQAAMQASLLHEPHNPAAPVVFKVTGAGRDTV
jgi:hypothetical protein